VGLREGPNFGPGPPNFIFTCLNLNFTYSTFPPKHFGMAVSKGRNRAKDFDDITASAPTGQLSQQLDAIPANKPRL
jgi:hypothetical protein